MPNPKWKEELKPKVTVYQEFDEVTASLVQGVLDEYWEELEPKIASLLESVIEDIPVRIDYLRFNDEPIQIKTDGIKAQLKAKYLQRKD